MNKNIVFIGMPSSGKSTIGQLLAQRLHRKYIDTDHIIVETQKKTVRDIVKEDGLEAFLEIQEKEIVALQIEGYIIATGGSAIYSNKAMQHLKKDSLTIYLQLSIQELEKRLGPDRRLARNSGQSIMDIYNERTPIYESYADVTIACSGKTPEEIIDEIISYIKLKNHN